MKIGILLIILALIPALGRAEVVQIIHTNDLHSFFEGTRSGKGGYARIKTKILELRAKAKQAGFTTLHLDGGDFGEGSTYFLSEEGATSLKMLDALGVDVSVIGNHDFMLGGPILANQIKKANLKAVILSANLKNKNKLELEGIVKDSIDIKLNDLTVRVFGLTTDQIHFQYPIRPLGQVSSSHREGVLQATKANNDKIDFTIALTHTGLKNDIKLARKTKSIDLIVGGHSHTRLQEVQYQENLLKRPIPIVQTGAHGVFVGELIIDIQAKGKSKVLEYKLHPITSDLKQETQIKTIVESAHHNREKIFERKWNEPIGYSNIPLSGIVDGISNKDSSCWGKHMARMVKENTNADIGIHLSYFEGEAIPAGVITFGDIIDNFPHFRSFGDQGWQAATSNINGWLLKQALQVISQREGNLGINFDGLEIESTGTFKINNQSIVDSRVYVVAYPSEIIHAIQVLIPFLTPVLFPKHEIPDIYYWPMIESYVRENSPIQCLD